MMIHRHLYLKAHEGEVNLSGNLIRDEAPAVMAGAFVYIGAATQVKILRNFHKTALLHLQKYRISVIMSIV